MRWILPLLLLGLVGCGTTKAPTAGRGLYWSWGEQRLQNEGYPGRTDAYSSPQWGVLYDDEGIPYGPRSYYEGTKRLDHPHLIVTEGSVESRWLRVQSSDCCTESLLGHYLEICDLAWVDLTSKLGFVPADKLNVRTSANNAGWTSDTGREFWMTHIVDGPSILLSPVDVLFRRTLAAHTAFASIAQSLLDLKTHGRIPMWLREGISSYVAQEGFEHLSFMGEFRLKRSVLMTPTEVERHVYPLVDRENGRIARYNSFLMVWHLSETWGWGRLRQVLDQVEAGGDFHDVVEEVYGMEFEDWIAALDPTVNGEPTTVTPQHNTH